MFRFDFFDSGAPNKEEETHTGAFNWAKCEEILPNLEIPGQFKHTEKVFTSVTNKTIAIKYMESPQSRDSELQTLIEKIDRSHSDLLPGVYEGGLKIWECTTFLLNYLLDSTNISFENKSALDLGCGAGIVGILAAVSGASHVAFQDYNSAVLKHVTIPNVLLNLDSCERFKFYSGDWESFATQNNTYDVILTSETIYNKSNYGKLHKVFQTCLKEDGVIYLAAKTYYFGVGGSLRDFEDLLRREGLFEYRTCWKTVTDVPSEILEIKFKK